MLPHPLKSPKSYKPCIMIAIYNQEMFMTHILLIKGTQRAILCEETFRGWGQKEYSPPLPKLLNKALVWLLISPLCVFFFLAGNPNPVTTAPQEESLPDLSHSDVTHLLPPSVAVASGMGRPTSSSSSSSSSYSLMPGTGAGRGYSDDERDSVEDTLKNLEEKTQKMHGMLNCFC